MIRISSPSSSPSSAPVLAVFLAMSLVPPPPGDYHSWFARAFTGYSYFRTRNPKCHSALHADERQRLVALVNSVRKGMVRRYKALYFGIGWHLPMENKAYEDLRKRIGRTETCTLFTQVPDNEQVRRYGRRRPAVELELMFKKSFAYMRKNLRCRDNNRSEERQCFVGTGTKSAVGILTWLLHYKTTKLGCAGAFCVRTRRSLRGRRGKVGAKYLKFHCLSDYQEKTKDLLFTANNGWCRSDARCSQISKGAYCDSAPTTYITHMCWAPPSPLTTCNDRASCRDYPTRPEECKWRFHLCATANMPYRELLATYCARTCGTCGLVDKQRIYPSCPSYAQFCKREEVRSDCRRSCYTSEYLARGARPSLDRKGYAASDRGN